MPNKTTIFHHKKTNSYLLRLLLLLGLFSFSGIPTILPQANDWRTSELLETRTKVKDNSLNHSLISSTKWARLPSLFKPSYRLVLKIVNQVLSVQYFSILKQYLSFKTKPVLLPLKLFPNTSEAPIFSFSIG